MFEAAYYAGGLPPPVNPDMQRAAELVCRVLSLNPFEVVDDRDWRSTYRRDAIAQDCARLLLMMQALAALGYVARGPDNG